MNDDTKEIVRALKGIRTTLAWIALWVFITTFNGPTDIVKELREIVVVLKTANAQSR